MKYRIKFTKTGPIKYTGHLDVMRFFQRAIRRAELPIAYSEGYSPHQILSFAFPLSVGYTSEGEYFDMELTERVDEDEIVRRLNECSNEFIRIVKAGELPDDAKNCMSVVFASEYEVYFKESVSLPFDYASQYYDYISQREILVQKPKKKGGGFIDIDLKGFIYGHYIPDKERTIAFMVNSSSSDNIKPDFFAGCFMEYCGITLPERAINVHRLEIYENAGDDENILLKPLLQG